MTMVYQEKVSILAQYLHKTVLPDSNTNQLFRHMSGSWWDLLE